MVIITRRYNYGDYFQHKEILCHCLYSIFLLAMATHSPFPPGGTGQCLGPSMKSSHSKEPPLSRYTSDQGLSPGHLSLLHSCIHVCLLFTANGWLWFTSLVNSGVWKHTPNLWDVRYTRLAPFFKVKLVCFPLVVWQYVLTPGTHNTCQTSPPHHIQRPDIAFTLNRI